VRPRTFFATLLVWGTAALFSIFLTLGLSHNAYAQTPTPVLTVTGTTPYVEAGEETSYHIELLNNTDQVVYDGVISITLPVSFTYVPSSTVLLGEGWPMESREPAINGQTLTWGPYNLPAAGITEHNPYGIHTLMHDCSAGLHLDGAKTLIGNGGYVKQIFYGIDTSTTGPSDCAVNFVNEAYSRNLIPIIRLQGHFVNGMWQAPNPGPDGDYSEIAQAFARYVSGLPRRNTNPIYIEIWNEPDLWIEWSNRPNATQYARFFVAVSRAIKQLGDARIRVLNGALTPGNMTFYLGDRDGMTAKATSIDADNYISDIVYNQGKWIIQHAEDNLFAEQALSRFDAAGAVEVNTYNPANGQKYSASRHRAISGGENVYAWNHDGRYLRKIENGDLTNSDTTKPNIGALGDGSQIPMMICCDPTGQYLMGSYDGVLGKRSDDYGATWGNVVVTLGIGYDVWENCDTPDAFLTATAQVVKFTNDFGDSWITKTGNLATLAPLCNIRLMKFMGW
jgi:hypothetical protein